MHQVPHASGHDDGLICSNAPQSSPVQVIEVSVSDEYQIDGRQMMNFEAWSLQPFDHLKPLDQIGSINILRSWVWTRNEACPIQVMQISPSRIFGNCGGA